MDDPLTFDDTDVQTGANAVAALSLTGSGITDRKLRVTKVIASYGDPAYHGRLEIRRGPDTVLSFHGNVFDLDFQPGLTADTGEDISAVLINATPALEGRVNIVGYPD